MRDQSEPVETERVSERQDVLRVDVRASWAHTCFARVPEAAKVRDGHIEARSQGRNVSVPSPPELRPAVEQDQRFPLALAHVVHVKVVDLGALVVPVPVGSRQVSRFAHRATQPPENGKTWPTKKSLSPPAPGQPRL